MRKSAIAVPLGAAASLLGGAFASRRTIGQWRSNPDPLDGVPVRFPMAEKRRVPLDDGTEIATYSAGHGPVVVLVHGLTGSHHDWAPIATILIDAGYSVVAIDQRGHGSSSTGTMGFGSRQLGADLADVFQALDLYADALVGHSMGAMASMGFAANDLDFFEDRVTSFVIIASTGATNELRQSIGTRLGAGRLPAAWNRIKNQRLRLVTGLSVFGSNPSLHMVDEAIASFRACPEDVRVSATAALTEHDLLDELRDLDVVSLVIGADRDQLISQSQIAELHATLADSELHTYPDAGHMVIWEEHADIAERIMSLVDDVGQTQVSAGN